MIRIILAVSFAAPLLLAETPVQHLLENKLRAHIQVLDDALPGVLGVATIDLASSHTFSYNGDAVFPTASSIKIPILVEMFKTVKDLDQKVTITPAESVGGSGRLQEQLKKGPVTLTIRQLITAMIEWSDNTATNKCIAIVHMERVNQLLAGLGFRATRLRRIMMDTAAAERGEENVSSPNEMARFVELLYRGKLASPDATRQMIDIMKLVKADMRRVIPANIAVASKTGELEGVRCETGVIYLEHRPFIISVFSTFLDENANPVGDVTKMVFDFFQKLGASNDVGRKIR
jgi:beta-lactamase class A